MTIHNEYKDGPYIHQTEAPIYAPYYGFIVFFYQYCIKTILIAIYIHSEAPPCIEYEGVLAQHCSNMSSHTANQL